MSFWQRITGESKKQQQRSEAIQALRELSEQFKKEIEEAQARQRDESDLSEPWVQRNLDGIELEKAGKVVAAIALYEANIADGFPGSHPYNRLAIIYRKQKRYADVVRVLARAVQIYEREAQKYPGTNDKLLKFRAELEKAKAKMNMP